MSFGRKRELILALRPDVLIVQEASRGDIEDLPSAFKHWVGSNPHKGLAVVAFANHDYQISDLYTDELPWFVPLRIENLNLNVLGVWAHVKNWQLRYVRLMHAALDHYRSLIESAPAIIAGDFNSNVIWDKKHGKHKHSLLIDRLDALGLRSLHHELSREEQGREQLDTWYMYRKRDRGCHIDYAFVPRELIPGSALSIGDPEEWLTASDHMPLSVEISDSALVDAGNPTGPGALGRQLREETPHSAQIRGGLLSTDVVSRARDVDPHDLRQQLS